MLEGCGLDKTKLTIASPAASRCNLLGLVSLRLLHLAIGRGGVGPSRPQLVVGPRTTVGGVEAPSSPWGLATSLTPYEIVVTWAPRGTPWSKTTSPWTQQVWSINKHLCSFSFKSN